jgi:sigma-B regulation protein RsbU (phosphoserine phosphatase)
MMNLFSSYRYRVVQKLLLLFAIISLVPLAVLGGLTLLNVQSSFTGLYRTMFMSFSSSAASEMDLFLNERLQELVRLAENPVIIEAAVSGSAASESLGLPELSIEQLEERYNETKSLKVSPAVEGYLRGYQEASSFAEIFLTDRHGFNVSITQPTSDFVQSDEGWWQEAKAKATYVSSVLFDESAKVMGLEMAVRVREQPGGRFSGVIKGIFDLSYIDEVRAGIKFGDSGSAALVDARGTIISHPDPSRRMGRMAGSQAVMAGARGETGVIQEADPEDPERRLLVSYAPLRLTGWVLLVRQDLDEAQSYLQALLTRVAAVGAGVFVLILLIGAVGAAWFSKPIDRLIEGARRVSGGDFETKIEVASSDEIGQLAAAFNQMTADLRRYVDDLRETTAAKERVESQLKIAREIQDSILPHGVPQFPGREEIRLFAVTQPAREMGGDFYDYFLLDDHRIGLVIADVSDKGVPAALLMAITKTMLKSVALKLGSPVAVLQEVNRVISQDNEKCMFVTVFYGIVDCNEHRMIFANAGHNLPYVVRAGNRIEEIPKTKGIALGVVEDLSLEEGSIPLNPGDTLVCYTDGITEAPDVQGAEFGQEQLVRYLRSANGSDLQLVGQNLIAQVMVHQAHQLQYDDITCLFFQHA